MAAAGAHRPPGTFVDVRMSSGSRPPSALVWQARKLVTRLSDGLATSARRLEFQPFRLRVIGTAGSGKTQLERIVSGDRHMMLAGHIRSEADVAAGLARDAIADSSERCRERRPGQVPRKLHATMTSSRTK